MSIIDKKLEPPLDCSCGSKIITLSIGYGRTPYMIQCGTCRIALHDIMPGGVGWGQCEAHAIEAWNDYHKAVTAIKDRGVYKPTDAQIREYMYRELKGWGQHPHRSRA